MCDNILIFFNLLIKLLTCMRTCATSLDISTSVAVNCLFSFKTAGILNNTSTVGSFSSTKYSRSVRTQYPQKNISRNPELNFTNSSDTRPSRKKN